jgi:hypothetical protein
LGHCRYLYPDYRNRPLPGDWQKTKNKQERKLTVLLPASTVMKNYILLLVALIVEINVIAQPSKNEAFTFPKNTMVIVNHDVADEEMLSKIQKKDLLGLSVLKDSDAIQITQDKQKNIVYILTTKQYAHIHRLDYLESRSKAFADAYSSVQNKDDVVFIKNGEVLDKNNENLLYFTTDINFKSLKLIHKDQLIEKYNIHNKQLGVILTVKTGPND